jgi:para-nitrobenzyl esterase
MRPVTPPKLFTSSLLIGLLSAVVLASGCARRIPATENVGRESPNQGPVLATTTSGPVRGAVSNGLNLFKGIPYGGPTSGKNRFMPPTRPAPWTEVRDALAYGPRCAQRSAIGANVDPPRHRRPHHPRQQGHE